MNKYRIAVRFLLALLAAAALACLAAFAAGLAQDLARRGQQERLAAVRVQEEELRRLSAEHRDWQNLPGELQKFRSSHVISMDDYARFRRDLNLLLDDNGFRAPDITSQFSPGRDRMRRVSLSFSLQGSYRRMKKFIYEMERRPGIHFFRRIELTGGDTVRGRFNMEVYLGQ